MNRRQFLLSATLLSSGLLPALAKASGARWRSASPLPVRTQEIYPAMHQGKLYVAGGIARRLGVPYFSDRCFSYDPAADRWTEIAALPEPLHHAALASDGDSLILAGGFNGGYTHVWRMRAAVYRLLEEGWVEDGKLPGPQAEGVLATSPHGDIHLVTGQSPRGDDNGARSDHVEVSDHWVRAAGGNNWEPLAPIPTARNSATGGWVGDHLIVTGGRTAEGNLDPTEIYDLREDRWRSAAPLPLPQAGTASAVVEDGLIVFGGEIFQPQSAVFPNVWRYSLSRDTWTAMPDMPSPRHGIGAGKLGDEIFVIGGATEPGGSGTSDANEVLQLAPSH